MNESSLRLEAYRQGKINGLRGHTFDAADWEGDCVDAYTSGYDDGYRIRRKRAAGEAVIDDPDYVGSHYHY